MKIGLIDERELTRWEGEIIVQFMVAVMLVTNLKGIFLVFAS